MSCIQLSERARQTPPSPIRRLAHLAKQAQAAGNKVYHLNIGQPDIKSPEAFFEGIRLFSDDVISYEVSEGNRVLREAWASFMNKSLDLELVSSQFLITTGASEALIFVFMTCCDPGDEVLIFDPTYANYMGFAAISGVKLVSIVTKLDEDFSLPSSEEIEAKITPRTKAILLCSPNNPTGAVATKEQLKTFIDYANECGAVIIFDAAYSAYISDPDLPRSIYEIDGATSCAIEISSFSKEARFTGVRLGWTVVPQALHCENAEPGVLNAMWRRRQNTMFNGASNVVQPGGVAVLSEQGQRESRKLAAYYMANAATTAVERKIDYYHMPVPRDRNDDAYFEPLKDFNAGVGKLYLGLVHVTGGVDTSLGLLASAQRHATGFGVATECGFGRRPSESMPELLEIHRIIADAL